MLEITLRVKSRSVFCANYEAGSLRRARFSHLLPAARRQALKLAAADILPPPS